MFTKQELELFAQALETEIHMIKRQGLGQSPDEQKQLLEKVRKLQEE